MKLCASTLFLILAIAGDLFGQERDFPQYNFAIRLPEGWQLMTNLPARPGVIATFVDAAKIRQVVLLVYDHKASGSLDDRFISEFERGMESSGAGKRVSGRFIEVCGIKSYERLGNVMADGKRATSVTQVIPVKGRLYLLQGLRREGEVSDDPEIRNCLATFRFITSPVAQTGLTPKDASFRTFLWTGFTLGIIAGIAILRSLRKSARSQRGAARSQRAGVVRVSVLTIDTFLRGQDRALVRGPVRGWSPKSWPALLSSWLAPP
jgi:hypothetical protein